MTEKPIIWGRGSSTNVQKVLWTAHELGIDADRRIVGGPHGGTNGPEFLALNPNGTVPVWQQGSFALWESHAIMRHLARKAGRLYGQSEEEIALNDQWLDWTAQVFWPPVRVLFLDVFKVGDRPRSTNGGDAALDRVHKHLGILEQAIAGEVLAIVGEITLPQISLGIGIMNSPEFSRHPRFSGPAAVRTRRATASRS
jgi:glutathione S-transferase